MRENTLPPVNFLSLSLFIVFFEVERAIVSNARSTSQDLLAFTDRTSSMRLTNIPFLSQHLGVCNLLEGVFFSSQWWYHMKPLQGSCCLTKLFRAYPMRERASLCSSTCLHEVNCNVYANTGSHLVQDTAKPVVSISPASIMDRSYCFTSLKMEKSDALLIPPEEISSKVVSLYRASSCKNTDMLETSKY